MKKRILYAFLMAILSPSTLAQTYQGEGIFPKSTSTYTIYPYDPETGQQIEVVCTTTIVRKLTNLVVDLDATSVTLDVETTVSEVIGDPTYCGSSGTTSYPFSFVNVNAFPDGAVFASNSAGSFFIYMTPNASGTDLSGWTLFLESNTTFVSGWVAASGPEATAQCDPQIAIGPVLDNLNSGFAVDPSGQGPFPPIWEASQGANTRGFIDVEQGATVSFQCETDHFAIYVWFAGLATAPDLIENVLYFRGGIDVSLEVDGAPIGLADFEPYVGASPSSHESRGILKVASTSEPGDLAPGIHYAVMKLRSDIFPYVNGDLRVGFYVRPVTLEAMLDILVNTVMSFNLKAGISNALSSKLDNAQAALVLGNAGDIVSAVGMLTAFINGVEAQIGKSLTVAQGEQLISQAELIVARLHGT